ncbi:unnamed protein product [Adineta steineri]|uniref:t-SNARE coiled-coil homology domain-containing protein n=1 Tax=Adineta steineri TaxID=433720 RepID=A0A814N5A9_9BILA|nr:unnamed protein product [Adineta steineri]
MTSDIIINKADFQRHLNGCERRLNDLTNSLQSIEKFAQKLLINNNEQEQEIYYKQLDEIIPQIKFLYSSMITLDQSSFVENGRKRIDSLKSNLEKNRIKFEQIQQYARIKFGYEYKLDDFEEMNGEQQEQSLKLIEKKSNDERIELDVIKEHTVIVNGLEKDISELHGAFIDINRLIHEQGAMVDTIEHALTTTDVIVHEAKEAIQAAVDVKKRSSRKKWILIFVLISILIIIIVILCVIYKVTPPIG